MKNGIKFKKTKPKKTFNVRAIARDVCKIEGGAVNLTVAQVAEVISKYEAVKSERERGVLGTVAAQPWYVERTQYMEQCYKKHRKAMLAAGIVKP